MYNCRRRTKVVPVRRRCCLSSPQCAQPCLKAPFSCHSLIPAYPVLHLTALPSTLHYYKKPMFCPNYTYHSSLHTPTFAVSTTTQYSTQYSIRSCLPATPCLPKAPCPASFNQVAPQSPSQVPDNLPSVINTPSGQITQLNPAVRNRNLLNTMFKFKKDAPLRQFIHDITKVQKNYYSLAEILTVLKDVISSEKMFDERNPSVIICSKPLEAALNQRALHVTEVRDLVINQLERLADQSLRDNQPFQRINSSHPRSQLPQTAPLTTVQTASITTKVHINKDTKYRLKPLFLEVVRTVDEVNPKKTVFTYEEITSILSKYILSKKNAIFDKRNIKLALVEKDPLGKAFGVTAFHRCQVTALLRTQLIPLHPNSSPDQLSTTTNKATYSRVAILL